MGADEAADKAFFTAIAFTPQNPIATEFLENARAVLHSLTRGGFARRREADLRQIPKVSAGIAKWLSR
jgi:DNA-binding FadR family transcriptional regulator